MDACIIWRGITLSNNDIVFDGNGRCTSSINCGGNFVYLFDVYRGRCSKHIGGVYNNNIISY